MKEGRGGGGEKKTTFFQLEFLICSIICVVPAGGLRRDALTLSPAVIPSALIMRLSCLVMEGAAAGASPESDLVDIRPCVFSNCAQTKGRWGVMGDGRGGGGERGNRALVGSDIRSHLFFIFYFSRPFLPLQQSTRRVLRCPSPPRGVNIFKPRHTNEFAAFGSGR